MSTEPDNVPLPFFVQAPPPLAVRGLSYTIIFSFNLAVVFSIVIKLPVTVTGRFVLVPVRGTDPIRATRGGIMTDVNVKEGDPITLGAPLFILRSEFTANRVGEARTLEIRIEGAEGRIKNARKKHDSQVKADNEQANGLQQRIASGLSGNSYPTTEHWSRTLRSILIASSIVFCIGCGVGDVISSSGKGWRYWAGPVHSAH